MPYAKNNLVSLFQSLYMKQRNKTPESETSTETKTKQTSLKAIAINNLQRNNERNKVETSPQNERNKTLQKESILFHEFKVLKPTKCIYCRFWEKMPRGAWWIGFCKKHKKEVSNISESCSFIL